MVGVVKPGSPADRAGIRAGDKIVAINGSAIDQATTMSRTITSMAPGQTAQLRIIRGSGSQAHRLTISVVIGSANGEARQTAGRATRSSAPSSSNTEPAAASKSAASAAGAPLQPLAVGGYERISDPLENAFTVEVPKGWRSEAGLARRAALQINAYVRSLSPDKMTYLIAGEPTMPVFAPPSQMGNAIGHPEGTLYDSGLGGVTMVLRYLPGAQFARTYGQSELAGLCPGLKFSSASNRPDLAQKAERLLPTVIPSRYDGGEARFSCVHNKQEMAVRVEAATRTTRDGMQWSVLLLWAFITPKSEAERADAILNHIIDSISYSQAWIQKQNNLSEAAARQINARIQQIFQQERSFMQKLNSVDENWESMDELVSGFSTYRDAATGNSYSLSNTNAVKWIDPSSGRILSTPDNNKPMWAAGYSQLQHSH